MTILFVVDSDASLLPHFVRHYAALGVTRFRCCVVNNDPAALVAMVPGCNLEVLDADTRAERREADDNAAHVRLRERYVAPGEWFLMADLDELHVFPRPLAHVFAECDAHGWDAIFGRFVDRVALDGSLKRLDSDRPLEEQYPLCMALTERLLRGKNTKVMGSKGNREISPGRHEIWGPHKPHPEWFEVHHYKWRDGLLERLRSRAREQKALSIPWWVESQRFLDHWARHGRINVDDPQLR